MKRAFLVLSLLLAISAGLVMSAQPSQASLTTDINTQIDKAGEQAGLQKEKPQTYIASFIPILLSLTGTVFLILLVYAGYLRLSSHGEEDRIEKSTKTMIAAIVGIMIVILSYAITRFVLPRIYNATSTDAPRYETNQYPEDIYGQHPTLQLQ